MRAPYRRSTDGHAHLHSFFAFALVGGSSSSSSGAASFDASPSDGSDAALLSDSPPSDPEPLCSDVTQAFEDYVAAHSSCSADGDCTILDAHESCDCEGTLGTPGGTPIRSDAVDAATALLVAPPARNLRRRAFDRSPVL